MCSLQSARINSNKLTKHQELRDGEQLCLVDKINAGCEHQERPAWFVTSLFPVVRNEVRNRCLGSLTGKIRISETSSDYNITTTIFERALSITSTTSTNLQMFLGFQQASNTKASDEQYQIDSHRPSVSLIPLNCYLLCTGLTLTIVASNMRDAFYPSIRASPFPCPTSCESQIDV